MKKVISPDAHQTPSLIPEGDPPSVPVAPRVLISLYPMIPPWISAPRVATLNDLPFVMHLQRKFSNQVGFLPKVAIETYIQLGCVMIATENEDNAGYILGRPSLRWNRQISPITQACVAMDARRRSLGLAMLLQRETVCLLRKQTAIQAMCREGLEANEFWRAAGFTEISRTDPSNARQKLIICWRRILTDNPGPELLQPPPYAGPRARKTIISEVPDHE